MRGVVFTGERGLELMPFEDPTPEAHDVVIGMKASGMCGSDLNQYRRPKGGAQASGIPMRDGPVIAGHEPCGVVVAVGSAGDGREAPISPVLARRGVDKLFTHRWNIEQADEAYQLFDRQVDGKGVF